MEITYPDSGRLVVDGCRRLTGPSLVWSQTGAILDVLVEDMEMDQVLDCWYRQLDLVLSQLSWENPKLTHRRFENGFNLLIAAPIDQLYSAVLVLETAWYFCACELLELEAESRDRLIEDIREEMRLEKNDALIELQTAAGQHGVDFLVDDEVVSIGHGQGSIGYMVEQIPPPQQINWTSVHDVPVAMITGTNGKSTSVRLLDGIARAAGQVSGVTSTDFVRVGDDVLDQGDYSGPGGARLLLRDPRLEVAFLEVARGGILRRGLPLRRARAALVTNVANDHLGQYGVNTLQALTETKFAVSKTLAENGVLVVNADDAGIVDHLAQQERQNLCWFSLDKSNPRIQYQLHNRGRCCFIDDDDIVNFDGAREERICAIKDIPMTINGAALHNVRNALGAVGVASAMEYTSAQMRTGLCRFNSDECDNPGRLNSFVLQNSVHVIIDFAHNAHSVEAVTDTVRRMPAQQKWALFGSAGDRSDDEIAAIASGVCSLVPDHVVIAEIEPYLRGRALGEVGAIMKQACLDNGIPEERIYFAESPLAGVKLALSRMQEGDLGLFLVLSERDEVIDYVNSR
jgi:cyanophycin synthetase